VLATALALASRGLHVFPCRPRAKEPATAHGLLDATCDTDVIKSWWHTEPAANLAVRTGAISNLVAIDVDGGEAETALAQLEAEHGVLPPSVETITARGRHIWFRHPGGTVPNSASKIAEQVDVRGDGGYVLAPPSMHPSGRRYAWSVDCAPRMADLPPWLLDLLTLRRANGNGITSAADCQALANGIAEGQRNSSLTKLCGLLLRRRVEPVLTRELIHSFNLTHCSPPLDAREVETIVRSICEREFKRRGYGDGR
jgi:hypothetical protein